MKPITCHKGHTKLGFLSELNGYWCEDCHQWYIYKAEYTTKTIDLDPEFGYGKDY